MYHHVRLRVHSGQERAHLAQSWPSKLRCNLWKIPPVSLFFGTLPRRSVPWQNGKLHRSIAVRQERRGPIRSVQIARQFDWECRCNETRPYMTSLETSHEMGARGYSWCLFLAGDRRLRKTYPTMAGVSSMIREPRSRGMGSVTGEAARRFATYGSRVL